MVCYGRNKYHNHPAIKSSGHASHTASPASSLYKETFAQDWQVKYSNNPILKEESLALTPMVFVMWDERYQAFIQKYVAIDFLKSAEGRWGELHIVYPKENMWSDNPYYIIDAPWSSKEQRAAAEVFLSFLMSEPVQRESLKHGFRPGNTDVPVRFAESPFVVYQRYALQIEPGSTCEPPQSEVINNLLAIWHRSQGGR